MPLFLQDGKDGTRIRASWQLFMELDGAGVHGIRGGLAWATRWVVLVPTNHHLPTTRAVSPARRRGPTTLALSARTLSVSSPEL